MVAAVPTIVGIQLLLSFLNYNMSEPPRLPMHKRVRARVGWD
jgi:hypothetical protein